MYVYPNLKNKSEVQNSKETVCSDWFFINIFGLLGYLSQILLLEKIVDFNLLTMKRLLWLSLFQPDHDLQAHKSSFTDSMYWKTSYLYICASERRSPFSPMIFFSTDFHNPVYFFIAGKNFWTSLRVLKYLEDKHCSNIW